MRLQILGALVVIIALLAVPAAAVEAAVPATANPDAVAEVYAGKRTEANAAWWGFDPDDATEYLQAAIDSGVSRLIVPDMGTDWVVRPITLRSDLELILEEGVVVTAKKGAYVGTSESVFTARNVQNLTLRGYGATIRMHKEDYTKPPYPRGEWRMGIVIRGGKNVQILGLTIRDTGGDGIYLGAGARKWNEDVVIRDVVVANNHRQGISVISAKNLLIENSIFKETSGTRPMAGIDFEPNHPDERLENIIIRNSVFIDNEGPGIAIYPGRLSGERQISILMENLIVRGSTYGIHISVGAEDDHPGSEIVVRNCLIESSEKNGIRVNRKDGDALRVHVEDCVLRNAATASSLNGLQALVPIYLEADSRMGAVTFENVTVIDDKHRPALYGGVRSAPGDPAFFDIEGELKVVNPHGAKVRWDGPTAGVTLRATQRESALIPHDQFVTLPEYREEPVEVRVGPTIHIGNLQSSRPVSIIEGRHRPEIQLRYFEDGDIESVNVLVDEESVYSAPNAAGLRDFEIDTTLLPDGYHDLTVVVHGTSTGRMVESVQFATHNFEYLLDTFEGPKEVAWFGTVYNPKTHAQSEGWRYAVDRPEAYFGDSTRKVWGGASTESLVWETPHVRGFEIVMYVKEDAVNAVRDALEMAVSVDQKRWKELATEVEQGDTSAAGWLKLTVRGDVESAESTKPIHYVRLELRASSTRTTAAPTTAAPMTAAPTESSAEVHLGQATFRLLREAVAR